MTTAMPSCLTCRHFHAHRIETVCDAFPGNANGLRPGEPGIPTEIILGRHDHLSPYPGDHGILYEPSDDADLTFAPGRFATDRRVSA